MSISVITLLVISGFMALIVSEGVNSGGEIEPEWTYGTDGNVRLVSMSDDGQYIAAGSFDNSLYLFNSNSSTPLWSFTAHDDIFSVVISADGEYIAAGANADDRHLYFFHRDNSTPFWKYATERDPYGSGNFISLDISDDGEYIVAGHANDYAYLFSKDDPTPLWKFKCGSNAFTVSISSDGEYIAVGSFDGNIRFFGKDSSIPIWTFDAGAKIRSVALSEDGSYLAAGSMSGKLYFFKTESSSPVWVYDAGYQVWEVSVSDTANYIAAATDSGDVLFFEMGDNTPIWRYTTNEANRALSLSRNGEYILVGSMDDHAYLFRRDSSTPVWIYQTNDDVRGVTLSSDGLYAAVGSYDTNFYLFQTEHLILSASRSSYYPGELATIHASFNAVPANVSIQVVDPEDTTYVYDINEVDEDGRVEFSFRLTEDAILGDWKVFGSNSVDDETDMIIFKVVEKIIPPVIPHIKIITMTMPETINRSESIEAVFTIQSSFQSDQNISLVLQLFDETLVPIIPILKTITIPLNATMDHTLGFKLTSDAMEGSYRVKGMLFTKVPAENGYPLDYKAINIVVS